ncbi:MAG: hypothetical protein AAF443_07785 [Chlamydiota bacterium]
MSTFVMTFVFAVGLIAICFIFLSIGKLITGKSKWHIKRCANPEKNKSCPHCHPQEKKNQHAQRNSDSKR